MGSTRDRGQHSKRRRSTRAGAVASDRKILAERLAKLLPDHEGALPGYLEITREDLDALIDNEALA